MARIKVSLKGTDGTPYWRGLTDSTLMQPGVGLFQTLRGAVVGRDGTELRFFPGLVKVAEPGLFGEPMVITRIQSHNTQPTKTLVEVSPQDADTYAKADDSISLFIQGVVMTGGAGLDINGVQTATRAGKRSFVVDFDFSGWTWSGVSPTNFQRLRIFRGNLSALHGFSFVSGYPCVVGESITYGADGSTQKRSLATWVGSKTSLDWDSPTNSAFEYWPSPVNNYVTPTDTDTNKHTDFPARRKSNLDVAEDRLLMAVPGFGVMMSADIGVLDSRLSDSDPSAGSSFPKFGRWTRLLGVPKGDMLREFTTGLEVFPGRSRNDQLPFNGSQGNVTKAWSASETETLLPPNTTAYFAVGYKNRVTNEVGLASEYVRSTTGTGWAQGSSPSSYAGAYFTIIVPKPRNQLLEAADMSIVIYTTGADSVAGFYPIHEEVVDNDPKNGESGRLFITIHKLAVSESWDMLPQFPVLEQLPIGACAVRTIRGFTLSGGWIPNSSLEDDSLSKEEILVRRIPRNGVTTTASSIFNATFNITTLDAAGEKGSSSIDVLDEGENRRWQGVWPLRGAVAAGYKLPSSFQGAEAYLPWAASLTNTPVAGTGGNTNLVRLLKKINSWLGLRNEWFPRWEFDGKFQSKSLVPELAQFGASILVDKGILQVSEREHPGIAPATNRIPVDRLRGSDIRGIGRLADAAIVITEKETYALGWARSPIGADPNILSDQYGCIAPNSVVEFPGGVAWLSREGPVMTTGAGVRWLGEPIRSLWGDMKRDSQGMMWHSFGVCDIDRNLLIWGVRSDWSDSSYASASTDDARSFIACDELLCFHYPTQSWSTHRAPAGTGFIAAGRALSADGQWRTTFLLDSGNLYQLDDRFQDDRLSPISASATSAGASTTTFATGTDLSSIQDGQYGLIRDSAGALKWHGTLSSGTTSQITLSSASSWASGDTLEAGVRYMTFTTRLSRWLESDTQEALVGVVLRHTIRKDYPSTGSVDYTYATCTLSDPYTTDPAQQTQSLHVESDGYRMSGGQTAFRNFGAYNLDDWILTFEVFGTGDVRIKDIFCEVQQGG